jgi:hypothetical protein
VSKLDDIKGKVKVEPLIGLILLVAVVAGGAFFITGSTTNDTQVATVVPSLPPADNGTQETQDQGSIIDEISSGYYYAIPGGYYTPGGNNHGYIDLDQFEIPGKETNDQSEDNDKEDSGVITPIDQHDDDEDGDDLWEYPEAEEEDLDPEDILLPGDDGFPDDLFPEENPDDDTSNNDTSDNETIDDETPGSDVEIPDDIGDVENVDPTEDEDEFPEETPEDMPDDDWIDDWING